VVFNTWYVYILLVKDTVLHSKKKKAIQLTFKVRLGIARTTDKLAISNLKCS